MQIDLNELRKRSEYIACREHPTLDLLIWNYTTSCQWDKAWDEYTRMTRGLITDLAGNVMAMPFPKFFNVGEELRLDELPVEIPEIRTKYDGWFGCLYIVGDYIGVSSRGSFDSVGANWATKWIQRYVPSDFKAKYTYVFEIVCPLTRIILDYGDRAELVLLAVIHTEDRTELDIDAEGARLGLTVPEKIEQDIWSLWKDMEDLPAAQEGYVLRYPDGFRIKMKGHEYSKIARALQHCSTTAIWEWVVAGGTADGLNEYLPAELWEWVETKAKEILVAYAKLLLRIDIAYNAVRNIQPRCEQVETIKAEYKDIAGFVMLKVDGKALTDYSLLKLRKMVKPEFEKPILGESI